MSDDLLLSLLWAIPLGGCLFVLLIPKTMVAAIRGFALGVTVLTSLLTLVAFSTYTSGENTPMARTLRDRAAANPIISGLEAPGQASLSGQPTASQPASADGDLVVRNAWIPAFNIQYYLGLDGISLSLILLAGLVNSLACLASFSIEKNVKGYFSLFLLLTSSMMGVFLALDMFLFYVFFEVMLLPMYFLIAIWGGENREYAAIKFLLYTLFGSVFILVAILILFFSTGDAPSTLNGVPYTAHSFDAVKVAQAASETSYYGVATQRVVFLLFLIGFLVKLPSFPFHTWLPDAHVQAPTPISMILAGVLLKIGGYGLIRLAWPLAPAGAYDWAPYVAGLGVFSIIYGALAAMAQTDFKKLVAYSSVSHMGYVTLGMAAMNLVDDPRYYAYGVNGAMFMMLAHGITSTGMFFLVGVIYERAHTRDLNKFGGLWNVMPMYGAVSFLLFFGSMGLPGLCGFIAEVFVVLAAFKYSPILGVLAAAAVILTAGYILWTLQRIFLGKLPGQAADDHGHGHGHGDESTHAVEHAHGHHDVDLSKLPDLTGREILISIPLVVLTVIMGVAPQLILSWMSPSVDQMVNAVAKGEARVTPKPVIFAQPAIKATLAEPAAAAR
ncbi:NADH-quinone oxidoreductase subunit M [Isosphaeraceae bacterium EP7]